MFSFDVQNIYNYAQNTFGTMDIYGMNEVSWIICVHIVFTDTINPCVLEWLGPQTE